MLGSIVLACCGLNQSSRRHLASLDTSTVSGCCWCSSGVPLQHLLSTGISRTLLVGGVVMLHSAHLAGSRLNRRANLPVGSSPAIARRNLGLDVHVEGHDSVRTAVGLRPAATGCRCRRIAPRAEPHLCHGHAWCRTQAIATARTFRPC